MSAKTIAHLRARTAVLAINAKTCSEVNKQSVKRFNCIIGAAFSPCTVYLFKGFQNRLAFRAFNVLII